MQLLIVSSKICFQLLQALHHVGCRSAQQQTGFSVLRSLGIPPVRVQNALPQITKRYGQAQVRYNFHVSARTQQDDMHHRSILTTRMKKQEEEEEEEGALLRVSTSPSSTELPRINHN